MPSSALAHVAAAAILVVSGAAWVGLDGDFDGLATYHEFGLGTAPWDGDSDGDAIADGWEADWGLDPTGADSDGDGLRDRREVDGRTNPLATDSDRDGLGDDLEGDGDCDDDGLPAGAEGDDDADGRLDPLEPVANRCRADVDGDGLLDGSEGALVCVARPDCDGDGLADALEAPEALSPLDADTFDVGLPDSVSWAFAQQGQPAGRDADADGIPDPWEGADGAIQWGDLTPSPGRRDLLLEYLRVEGPDSGRFNLDLSPAYRAVADTFLAQANIRVTWTETRVPLNAEEVPPTVPSITDAYYASALSQARHATNPFVTTVVLNPQHDQSVVAHSGIAPIRGMIAAVDYGQTTRFTFSDGNGSTLRLTPILEELVVAYENGGSGAPLIDAGFDEAGIGPGTRINLHATDGYSLSWLPTWFRSAIDVTFDGGGTAKFSLQQVTVDQPGLAHTILHELGHTLGLCHSHDLDCKSLSAQDRLSQAQSSMSYDSPDGTLRFLPSEWTTVVDYLTCPPVEPVTLRSQGASATQILDSKYVVSEDGDAADDARACRTFLQIPQEYQSGSPPAYAYSAPAGFVSPETGHSYAALLAVLALAAAGVAVAVDLLLLRRLRKSPRDAGLWD